MPSDCSLVGDSYLDRGTTERWSKSVHEFALVSTFYIIVIEPLPPVQAWSPERFNYDWALSMFTVLISTVVYLIVGKKSRGLILMGWRNGEMMTMTRHQSLKGRGNQPAFPTKATVDSKQRDIEMLQINGIPEFVKL